MTAINDLVSGVIHRIDSVPTNITGSPVIWEYLDDARIDVGNIIGAAISNSSVDEKYQSILKNLAAAYTLARMNGVGVDYDYSLGNFRVSKGAGGSNTQQIDFLLGQVNNSIKNLKTIPFKATYL